MQEGRALVQSIGNPEFSRPPVTTMASSIVRRMRYVYPCNTPSTTIGNVNTQGGILNKVIFDLQNARDFIDLSKLCIKANIMPQFLCNGTQSSAGAVGSSNTGNVWYDVGAGPSLDQNTQALLSYVRILTQQNIVIEEIPSYGFLANILEAHAESISHKEYSMLDFSCGTFSNYLPYLKGRCKEVGDDAMLAYDSASRLSDNLGMYAMPSLLRQDAKPSIAAGTPTTFYQVKSIIIPIYHASFLRQKYFPLNLMNNALRIEITFEDPRKAFYNNWQGIPPVFGGYLSSSYLQNYVAPSNLVAPNLTQFSMFQTNQRISLWTDGEWNTSYASPAGSSLTPNQVGTYLVAGYENTSTPVAAAWRRVLATDTAPTAGKITNTTDNIIPMPLFALSFRPGVVTATLDDPAYPRSSITLNATPVVTRLQMPADVVAPKLFEARVGQYWMFAYNGAPVTILKVVAIVPQEPPPAGATGGPAAFLRSMATGANPAGPQQPDGSFLNTANDWSIPQGLDGYGGVHVILADQGSQNSGVSTNVTVRGVNYTGKNFNEDVALLQQAYGVLPIAAYRQVTGAADPATTTTIAAQPTGLYDLNCVSSTGTITPNNTQTLGGVAGTSGIIGPGISADNLVAFNFNQIWLLPESCHISQPNNACANEKGSSIKAPLAGICDANGDYIRPRTAPSLALTPLSDAGLLGTSSANTAQAQFNKAGVWGGANSASKATQTPWWNYVFQDVNLIVDLVLPSDNVRDQYQVMWTSPNGINYPYTRVFSNYTFLGSASSPLQGMQQYVIPVKVRSLRSVLVVLTDPLQDNVSLDNTVFNFPSKSSFRMGGLYEAYLQIGGETYPAHRYRFDTAMINNAHIPELLSTLDVNMNTNYAPQYHVSRLHREGRNYMVYGQYDRNSGAGWGTTNLSIGKVNNPGNDFAGASSMIVWNSTRSYRYVDTSRFILHFTTSKIDGARGYMSGVDVAQGTGSAVLFLNFANTHARQLQLLTYSQCDAVFTLQESQPLIRL